MNVTGDAVDRRWRLAELVGFRFAFAYALLYFPILAVHDLPLFAWVDEVWNGAWALVVPWTARHVFRVVRGFPDTTSGLIDVRYAYARAACAALFAAITALVWSLRAPDARNHATLLDALRVLLRYGLANAMLFYGLSKVVGHQFEATSLALLVEPYGDQTPKDVLWHFMGGSRPYSMFGGLAECVGGVLLLSRRTTTLGALVTAAVMTNVVMLNLSFDVPVKLYSSHLLLMALFLASQDLHPLVDLLVHRRATAPAPLHPHFAEPRWNRAGRLVKLAFVSYLGLAHAGHTLVERQALSHAARPALYGIWEVTQGGKGAVWTRLVIDRADGDASGVNVSLWRPDGSRELLDGTEDAARQTLVLDSRRKGTPPMRFSYDRVDDRLVLSPEGESAAAPIELHRRDETSFRLVQGHFRWSVGDSMWR